MVEIKQVKKNFISINKAFTCINCGHKNKKHKSSCRNHCTKCLYSLHLDEDLPGDRKSDCLGLMEATKIDYDGKKGYLIIHKCTKCGKISKNKCAPDDDTEKIINLTISQ